MSKTSRHLHPFMIAMLVGLAIAIVVGLSVGAPSQAADADTPTLAINEACEGGLVRQFVGHTSEANGYVFVVAWSPDSKTFLTVGYYGQELFLWDLNHVNPIREYSPQGGEI